MNYTPNYALTQWEKTDRIRMEDFNANNFKIEQALSAETSARAAADTAEAKERAAADTALTAALASKGNCEIIATTYTGNGTNTCTLNFSKPPLLVVVCGGGCSLVMTYGCDSVFGTTGTLTTAVYPTWNGSSVTWTPGIQDRYAAMCNAKGQLYHVIALFTA